MPAGRPRRVSNEEILRTFIDRPEPVSKIDDVVPHVDLTKSGLYKRVQELLELGYLDSKSTGSSGKVYWVTEQGQEFVNAQE